MQMHGMSVEVVARADVPVLGRRHQVIDVPVPGAVTADLRGDGVLTLGGWALLRASAAVWVGPGPGSCR